MGKHLAPPQLEITNRDLNVAIGLFYPGHQGPFDGGRVRTLHLIEA